MGMLAKKLGRWVKQNQTSLLILAGYQCVVALDAYMDKCILFSYWVVYTLAAFIGLMVCFLRIGWQFLDNYRKYYPQEYDSWNNLIGFGELEQRQKRMQESLKKIQQDPNMPEEMRTSIAQRNTIALVPLLFALLWVVGAFTLASNAILVA